MKELIITYLPAFVLGFVWIFCTFTNIKSFTNEANKIKESSTYQKLEDHMKALLNENYDLKRQLKALLEDSTKKDQAIKELTREFEIISNQLKEIADNYELKLEEKNKEE